MLLSWHSSRLDFIVFLLSWTVSLFLLIYIYIFNETVRLIVVFPLNFTFELGFFLNGIPIAGSTQATRFTAARQLGEIAKSHPQDLTSLLKKVIIC